MRGPLAHRRYGRRTPTGVGVFRNLPEVQNPTRAIARGLLSSLREEPGIRLAEPTGRRVYYGTTTRQPQVFIAPAQVNRADQVRAGQRQMNARRALGRQRGLAPLGVDYAA